MTGALLAQDTLRHLSEAGVAGTLVSVAKGTFDEATGTHTTADSTASYAVKVHLANYRDRNRDGTTILARDRRATIAARGLAIAPKIDDRLTVSGVTYTVVDVHQVIYGGAVLAYVCQVRGAG